MGHSFEVGPIRPPSEATSLLLRVNRNCPWNRCAFCPVYKRARFSVRGADEVIADLEAMAAYAEEVRALSWRMGRGGAVDQSVTHRAAAALPEGDPRRQILLFLLTGGRTAFLQDANPLLAPAADLARIVATLRERFPSIARVTAYARSHTLSRRSVEELAGLRAAGLTRIHVGMESGADEVLALVDKGVTHERQVEAGRRVGAAGIELCEYVMPGLGGRALSDVHARETARAIREIAPDFVRLRTLALPPLSPLSGLRDEGRFEPLGDEAVVREIRLLLTEIGDTPTRIASDHVLNLLEQVEGRWPEDRPRLLGLIDRFLALDQDSRHAFILGRRLGIVRELDDLSLARARRQLRRALDELRDQPGGVDAAAAELMKRFV